jgi:hypothetical protein
MGNLKPSNKVIAAAVGALLAFLATQFGLDFDKQSETPINATAPVIVGYLWDENWAAKPNRKILAALVTAIIVYVVFRLGIDLSKPVENFINALAPVIVALIVPNKQGSADLRRRVPGYGEASKLLT